jgi:prepilin-type N-terminal cleavage/methylation domain-containing protein
MGQRRNGFTLVEIAIVLVVVGLLLGGILKGQEMITQAKIKNVVGDFSGLSAAYYGYHDRYRAIPGDDPGAAGRWSGTASGDGNGLVAGSYNSGSPSDESRLWWSHLRRAGFLSGRGTRQPFNVLAGMMGVQTGDGAAPASGPVLGTDEDGRGGFQGLIICSANLPDKIAVAVDVQMDDGAPVSGMLRGQLQTEPNPAIAKQATASYAETGSNLYTLCRTF